MNEVNKQLIVAAKDILALHDNEVFVADPWNDSMEDLRQAIAAAEQAQQAEPRCACGDSLTSDAMCANCLAAQPPAVATDAITDAMEANAWRAALRGLCTGRELMTPDECAEHVRHRIESAKSGTHRPDGYALVPIKPTDTMLDAAVSAGDEPGSDYYTIYAAMLAAAQKGGEA